MSKKNKDDFIDEEEFLTAVSMNKKGGCVRMGKPPQETDETPCEAIVSEGESPTQRETGQEVPDAPAKSREHPEKKKAERLRGQNDTLIRLKASKENVQRMSVYIRIDIHKRFSVAAGVYKTTIGQMVDAILDEWWEKNRDEVKSLYYRDREVFDED